MSDSISNPYSRSNIEVSPRAPNTFALALTLCSVTVFRKYLIYTYSMQKDNKRKAGHIYKHRK
jgi:hypothetical protein